MTVTITDANILAYANAVALIVPLFIIAILVDASKSASGGDQDRSSASKGESKSKALIKQSQRTLVSIAIGLFVEVESLGAILTLPNDSSGAVPSVNYAYVASSAIGLFLILFILFIPHVELHISTIRHDASSGRWTLTIGWIFDICIALTGVIDRFVSGSTFNHKAEIGRASCRERVSVKV